MSVANLDGVTLTAAQISAGTVGSANSDPITYFEGQTGTSVLGSGATVSFVVSGTTVTGTIHGGSLDGATLTGSAVGNDSSDILLFGSVAGQTSQYVYLTNNPANQPGVFNPQTNNTAASVPNETGTGAAITYDAPVCFASGTMIRTSLGDVPVEDLRIGDMAVTASGFERPIVWIGHQTMACALRPAVRPVRVRAGAFGSSVPERDLFLSPGHPVLVGSGENEVLVPIMCLINGTSIERTSVETVTYWHVELDQHDLLLAEGLAAESFLDLGIRSWFAKGADQDLTNPDVITPDMSGRCRPVAISGPLVEAERRRIDGLFYADLTAQCLWPTSDGISVAA